LRLQKTGLIPGHNVRNFTGSKIDRIHRPPEINQRPVNSAKAAST
jgi:hypothetical protein